MLLQTQIENKVIETIEFTLETCCSCGIPFMMPEYHRKRLLANKGESFYCPNGHGQHYSGKTEAEKLREQLENEKRRNERDREELTNRLLDTVNEKEKLEKKLRRVNAGVCPCCNRTFKDLQNHIRTKHPSLTP